MFRIVHFLREALPYVLQGALGTLALFGLLKDWKDYSRMRKRIRIAVLVFTVVAILGSILDTYTSRREARDKEQQAGREEAENKKQIEDLTDQVHQGREEIRQEREENKHNNDGFRESFDRLYQKYSDLAAKTHNAELLREIKETRDELKTTQERLNQPKARLIASFWKPDMSEADMTKQIDAVRNTDGSVSFDIITFNASDVAALKGAMVLRICMLCKYTKEPQGSQHLPGATEDESTFPFDHILSHTLTEKRTIEVTPIPAVGDFTFTVGYACENCVTETQTLHVKIVPQLRFPR